MGQRDAGVGGAAGGGGDAGHHLAGNAVAQEGFQLFGAASEDERIASLEPHHAPPAVRQAEQQQVDLFLRQAVEATALADVVQFAPFRPHPDELVGHQAVMDDHVSLLQQTPGPQGEQAGIAGTGADQRDATGFEGCTEQLGRKIHIACLIRPQGEFDGARPARFPCRSGGIRGPRPTGRHPPRRGSGYCHCRCPASGTLHTGLRHGADAGAVAGAARRAVRTTVR
ncbi:hypothetical protein D9M72_524690 [compost metagenome]